MKKTVLTSFLLASLTLSVQARSNDFSQAYSDYQQALESNDSQLVVTTAKRAYELGKIKFQENSDSTAALLMNYGSALKEQKYNSIKQGKKQYAEAHKVYKQALSIYQKLQPTVPTDIIDAQLKLAETAKNKSSAYDYVEDAIDTAGDSKLLVAKVKLEAFRSLSNKYYSKKLGRLAKEALTTIEDELPSNSIDRVKATYDVARIYEAEKKFTKAAQLFEEVVTQFDVLNYSHPHKLAAHARLVQIYEKQGESEQSTAHCLAIGKMKPWDDSVQEQTPLYRAMPKFPQSAVTRGKSGSATMEFTVDEYGFVKDIEVLASEGGRRFEKASIKAIEKWRYAPKFVDGKAVKAKTKIRLDYML